MSVLWLKQILATRSPYFTLALSSNWVKRENNAIIFAKPNILLKILKIILRYIYNGEISFDKHGVPTLLELLVTTDELILENFFDPLEDYLIEHHAKELEKNLAILQKTSFMHEAFKKLQKFCTDIAANNLAIVFNSQDFTTLSENALSSILTWDDLNIEESEIWEKIVEWGVAKLDNNIQLKNLLYWTDENFNALKEFIEKLLPLIRFFNISSVNFYHKLDHWIQGKNENTPFEDQLGDDFKLLLRGSRDGFTPADFHRLCDNKGATVSVERKENLEDEENLADEENLEDEENLKDEENLEHKENLADEGNLEDEENLKDEENLERKENLADEENLEDEENLKDEENLERKENLADEENLERKENLEDEENLKDEENLERKENLADEENSERKENLEDEENPERKGNERRNTDSFKIVK
ncbi:hypothetical protein G9A89_010730 [Geosiphon pyriformis]|nr:hypothetical protein G9A89_010730 [Geosiphon pyriformis]